MINIDNSEKLYEILESSGTNPNQCPPEVTYQMLEKELMCADLENADPTYSIDELWKIYYYNHKGSDNIFGFTSIHNNNNSKLLETIVENPIEEPIGASLEESIRQSLSQTSRNKSKSRQSTNTKKNVRKSSVNTRGSKTTRKSNRGNVRGSVSSSRRNNPYIKIRGGGKLYDANKAGYCDTLNKSIPSKKRWYNRSRQPAEVLRDFTPHWPILQGNNNTRQHTVTKLKTVNGTNLYVYGTSLPMKTYFQYKNPDVKSYHLVNNLLFYRYVKGVSRLIDLHGCNMNWDLISISNNTWTPFKPSGCDGLNEKRIWRRITRSDIYENNTKKDDDVYSRYSSFYWIDMSAGFFDTYHDIIDLSFDDPKLKSLIHCKAGFGRTGTVLLLIICKYYFNTPDKIREFQRIFDFPPNDRANRKRYALDAIEKLYDLLESHVEIDLINKRNEPCLRPEIVETINSEIMLFDTNWILYELFRGFYNVGIGFRRNPRDVLSSTRPNLPVIDLSLTELNVLITRINYILYFVASYNNIERVNLYELYSPYRLRLMIQRDGYTNEDVLAIPLLQPVNVAVGSFTKNSSDMYNYIQGSSNFPTIGMSTPRYKSQPPNTNTNIGNMSATERATAERIRKALQHRDMKNKQLVALQAIEEEEKRELERERQLSRQQRLDTTALGNQQKTPFVNPRDIIDRANTVTTTKADKFRTQPSIINPTQRQGRITEQDKKGLTDVSF